MPAPSPRERKERPENAARRRRQLIDATEQAIVEKGPSGATFAAVSRISGLSQGIAVFYFQTKENLLAATFEAHLAAYDRSWRAALAAAGGDDVERLAAMVLADLNPEICTPRNLALWQAFWTETGARPLVADLSDRFDGPRMEALTSLCRAVETRAAGALWTAESIARTLDAFTDGLWNRMHISPDRLNLSDARQMLTRLMVSIFPEDQAVIEAVAERRPGAP